MSGSKSNGSEIKTLADYYLRPKVESLYIEYEEGVKTGEPCRISALDKIFCYMPGFLSGTTGLANHGKTTYKLFLMLVKAVVDGKKFGIWSPEMIIAKKSGNKVERSANQIINILVHSLTGLNPYKHKGKQLSWDEYMTAYEFVENHFFIIDTERDRKHMTVLEAFRMLYYEYGIYGWSIDSWKNLEIDEGKSTKDRVLQYAIDDFKYMAMETNTVGDFILHPKSMKERDLRKNGTLKGPYRVITQHDLLGGSIWDNSLDSIHSYHRQDIHDDPNSPWGSFYCLKQKMQEITNKRGSFENIYFDEVRNRFYFNDVCPIDGSLRYAKQTDLDLKKRYEKKEEKVKENSAGYPEHWSNNSNDNMPF